MQLVLRKRVLEAREKVPDPVGTLLGLMQSRLGDDAGRRDPWRASAAARGV